MFAPDYGCIFSSNDIPTTQEKYFRFALFETIQQIHAAQNMLLV